MKLFICLNKNGMKNTQLTRIPFPTAHLLNILIRLRLWAPWGQALHPSTKNCLSQRMWSEHVWWRDIKCINPLHLMVPSSLNFHLQVSYPSFLTFNCSFLKPPSESSSSKIISFSKIQISKYLWIQPFWCR